MKKANDIWIVTFSSSTVWLSFSFSFFLQQTLIMFQIYIQEVHWPEHDKTVLVSFLFLFQSLVIHRTTEDYSRHCEWPLQLINHFLPVIIKIVCARLFSWAIALDIECHQVKTDWIWSHNIIYTCMFTSFKISYQ